MAWFIVIVTINFIPFDWFGWLCVCVCVCEMLARITSALIKLIPSLSFGIIDIIFWWLFFFCWFCWIWFLVHLDPLDKSRDLFLLYALLCVSSTVNWFCVRRVNFMFVCRFSFHFSFKNRNYLCTKNNTLGLKCMKYSWYLCSFDIFVRYIVRGFDMDWFYFLLFFSLFLSLILSSRSHCNILEFLESPKSLSCNVIIMWEAWIYPN